jgi:hypothetical protein
MRVIKSATTSIAASLLLGAVAHAADTPDGGYASVRKSEAAMVTGLPWNVPTVQRVSPASAYHYAEPHRTSKIGTGTMAAPQRVVETFRPVSAVKPHYPELQWSSTFGTGTAAALER